MRSLHPDTVGPVDAARALEDLAEMSPQIEAAAVVGTDGVLAGSVGVPEGHAYDLARAVRELLERAAATRRDGIRVTQVHAELGDGEVFTVTGADGRAVVAVVRERTAAGLVFYDLKRCLAAVESEDDRGS
jgi:predicted regulator of Ras-like GTPase activity (Roadblock/LC7/MglB family)